MSIFLHVGILKKSSSKKEPQVNTPQESVIEPDQDQVLEDCQDGLEASHANSRSEHSPRIENKLRRNETEILPVNLKLESSEARFENLPVVSEHGPTGISDNKSTCHESKPQPVNMKLDSLNDLDHLSGISNDDKHSDVECGTDRGISGRGLRSEAESKPRRHEAKFQPAHLKLDSLNDLEYISNFSEDDESLDVEGGAVAARRQTSTRTLPLVRNQKYIR